MNEPQRQFMSGAGAIAKLLLALFIVWIVVRVALPYAVAWYECQKLAPIERYFTKGC